MSANITALVPRSSVLPSANEWNTMMQMGDTLAKSGVLPEHIRNGAAVVAIVQKGKELGIPPMQAIQNIAFIKGKTTLQAELMLALVIRDCGVEALRVTHTDNTKCVVAYKRPGNEGTYAFTIDDAKQAGLVSAGGMYMKYPAAMLRSRCISATCRFVFPDIIGGMYTPEELGAVVDEEGNTVAFPEERVHAAIAETSVRLPWGVTPEQWANFHTAATAKGVAVDPTMTPDEIAGAIRRAGGPAIPGKITPGNAWEALKRVAEPVNTETDTPAPLEESPIEGESREDDDTFSDEAMAETARKSEAARQRGLTGN